MNPVRSVLFNILFFAGSFFLSVALCWTLLLPKKLCASIVSEIYGGYVSLIERYVLGLKLEIKGWEHLPPSGPYIIAAKHQSAFETLTLPYMRRLRYPAIIFKKELGWIPLWGWYLFGMGQIPVDRGAGVAAMHSLVKGCRKALHSGRSVIIFPQGTRVAVGAVKPYKAGIAKVYRDVGTPIIPLALNAGVFWGKRAFFKKSGTVTFEFLPPIPPGLPPLRMMEQLEKAIEEASDRLVATAK